MCILLNDITILIYIMFDLFIKFKFLRNKWRNISIELSQSLTFAAQIRLIVFIMVVHQIHYNRHHHSRNEAINIYRLCIIYTCVRCAYMVGICCTISAPNRIVELDSFHCVCVCKVYMPEGEASKSTGNWYTCFGTVSLFYRTVNSNLNRYGNMVDLAPQQSVSLRILLNWVAIYPIHLLLC